MVSDSAVGNCLSGAGVASLAGDGFGLFGVGSLLTAAVPLVWASPSARGAEDEHIDDDDPDLL